MPDAREEVLREFWPCQTVCANCTRGCDFGGREEDPEAMADEIVRLRAARDAQADELMEAAEREGKANWARIAAEAQRDAAQAQLANVARVEEWLRADPVRRYVEFDGVAHFDANLGLDRYADNENVACGDSLAALGAALKETST